MLRFPKPSGEGGSGLFRSRSDFEVDVPAVGRGSVVKGGVLGFGSKFDGIASSKSAKLTVCGTLALFGGRGGPSSTGLEATGPIRLKRSSSLSSSSECEEVG